MSDEVERLTDALRYAIDIIDSYEMDIRHREDLVEQGFCQGVIYREAIADIRRRAGWPPDVLGTDEQEG